MTVGSMRAIDRFLGVPLCWISGILRRISRRSATSDVGSILVIKFFGMGSILLSVPSLHSLRSQYPMAHIVFLSFSQHEELLELLPSIDEVWLIDPGSFRTFVVSLISLIRQLARTNIDVVLDLEFFSKFSTLLGSLAHPRMHIGFALPTLWRAWNLTHQIPLRTDQHVSKTFHDALSPLGIGPSVAHGKCIELTFQKSSTFVLDRELSTYSDIICINPNVGGTSLDRRWSPERFALTASILESEYPDAAICFTGAADEREFVGNILRRMKSDSTRILNLAGVLSLRDLIALYSHSSLVISNDSGPMHLAAALHVSTVAIFGPESPAFYGPIGNRSINLYAGLPCSPCLNAYAAKTFQCPIHQQCMKDVSVDDVVHAVRLLLADNVTVDASEAALL